VTVDDIAPFEPFELSWRHDPLATYEALRDRAPIYRAPSGMWVVSRYETVRHVLSDPETFSTRCVDHEALGVPRRGDAHVDPQFQELLDVTFAGLPIDQADLDDAHTVLGLDGAAHDRQRRQINRAFSPRRVKELRAEMQTVVAESIAQIADADGFDVMEDFANPLPRRIMGSLLGIDDSRHGDLSRWAHEIMGATSGADRSSAAARARFLAVIAEFTNYFVPLIESRRANPGDDFISDLVRAEEQDALSPLETLVLIRLLMIAGTDTTAALVGNTVLALLRHPEQLAALRADPALVPRAIEESLRYWAPFYWCLREVTGLVELEGATLGEGELIAVMLGSANHDEREFDDPATFDIYRENRHVAFGHGSHFCVGAHLARAEAQVAIEAILPHLDRFTLTDEPLALAESQFLQGFQRIPVVRRHEER
jgi:cytochrome P450